MTAPKNLYICCEEGREEFFKAKAKDIYKEYICIQDEIGKDTDMIVIIQPVETSKDGFITRCLEDANQMQIRAVVVSENFIPVGAMERMLKEG